MKRILSLTLMVIMLILPLSVTILTTMQVEASTAYVSDNKPYQEGYIFVGDTQLMYMALNVYNTSWARRNFFSLSKATSVENGAYKFTMTGNVFFVFEGATPAEIAAQDDASYIYSDGHGNRGQGVEKIRAIMASNTNIAHWNIISMHGSVACKGGVEAAKQYIQNYYCWAVAEFPGSNILIVSQPECSDYYADSRENVAAFNNLIKTSYPYNYLDFTQYYNSCYPKGMTDSYLWNAETYSMLFLNIMNMFSGNKEPNPNEYAPNEIGFIILGESHCGVLALSHSYFAGDNTIASAVPKENYVAIANPSMSSPYFWGGGITLPANGRTYEGISIINEMMDAHPNVKLWYITYFAGTNDVRYAGVDTAISAVNKNLKALDNTTFHQESKIALITTPHQYGHGHSFAAKVDSYVAAEEQAMKKMGYADTFYNAVADYDKYVSNGKLTGTEYSGYRYNLSGDGIHFYAKQYWTVTTNACNEILRKDSGK